MRVIKNKLIVLQSEAAALKGEFTSLGGNAMNDLTSPHNAIALSTIYSLGGYNTATKIAVG
jgi:hypothetical protein